MHTDEFYEQLVEDFLIKIEAKRIPGHPMYAITIDGKIWTLYRWRWMKHTIDKKTGYHIVGIDGSPAHVHVLVLTTYVCPRPRGLLGLHKDDNKDHNYLLNLQWGTHRDNAEHAKRNGKLIQGSFNADQVRDIRRRFLEGEPASSIAAVYKSSYNVINSVVSKRTYKNVY